MSDWTKEAAVAVELCETWAHDVLKELHGSLYLLGSAIYKGGEQFVAVYSDLDLIYLFPTGMGALDRCSHIAALFLHKKQLELNLIPALHRLSCDEPGVSLVPITPLELQTNVHKSGARRFFDRNFFYDLGARVESLSISSAGTLSVKDDYRQALEYVQKLRNQFLSVQANALGGLKDFAGPDPMPKALLRSAAQLVPDTTEGEWYDTRLGLEFMHRILTDRRTENETIKQLFDKISVRRGGRGQDRNLSSFDQLLLAELLFDKASEANTEPIVTWVLRVSGDGASKEQVSALLTALTRIAPDAHVIGVTVGSIVLTVRSSKQTLGFLQQLQALGALGHLLNAEAAEIRDVPADGEYHLLDPEQTRLSILIAAISKWAPQALDNARPVIDQFFLFLQEILKESAEISGATVQRDVTFEPIEIPFEMDFLLSWPTSTGAFERVGIEVVRLRSQATFFQKISQLIQLGRAVILVLVGSRYLFEKLAGDIERLATLNANVKVVKINVQD